MFLLSSHVVVVVDAFSNGVNHIAYFRVHSRASSVYLSYSNKENQH